VRVSIPSVPSIAPRGPATLSAPAGTIRLPGTGRWSGHLASLKGSLQGGAPGGARAITAPAGVKGVSAPNVRVPGHRGPNVAVQTPGGAKAPNVNINVKGPHVRAPGAPKVNVAGPNVRVPNVRVHAPNVKVPNVRVHAPNVAVPKVNIPSR
jgi:hypothetical protein